MLKTLLLIICDDCGEQFLYARMSSANRGPTSVDISALNAFALDKTYRWTSTQNGTRHYHYCPECSIDYEQFNETVN